jgi:hypothetical protein
LSSLSSIVSVQRARSTTGKKVRQNRAGVSRSS